MVDRHLQVQLSSFRSKLNNGSRKKAVSLLFALHLLSLYSSISSIIPQVETQPQAPYERKKKAYQA